MSQASQLSLRGRSKRLYGAAAAAALALSSFDAQGAVVSWVAGDLATGANGNGTLTSGSTVTSWVDTSGTRSMSNSTENGQGTPLLITGATPTGKAVVRFDGADDELGGTGAENPVAGTTAFSIAIVFKASAVGSGTGGQWWQRSGLVDAEQGGDTNDWGTVIDGNGNIGLGTGGGDITSYTGLTAPGVVDGSYHVAIFRYDGVTGNYDIYVDNGTDLSTTVKVDADPRNSANFSFGGITLEPNEFTGDFAEVRFYTGTDSLTLDPSTVISGLRTTYVVPEPASVAMLMLGALPLAIRRRSRG